MSMTNAQAALNAAAILTQPDYLKRGGSPLYVNSLARDFKAWLDSADAADARDAEVARKGTLDQRVTRLEEQVTPVPASAHAANGGAR